MAKFIKASLWGWLGNVEDIIRKVKIIIKGYWKRDRIIVNNRGNLIV